MRLRIYDCGFRIDAWVKLAASGLDWRRWLPIAYMRKTSFFGVLGAGGPAPASRPQVLKNGRLPVLGKLKMSVFEKKIKR
jgi:hypothetical protein